MTKFIAYAFIYSEIPLFGIFIKAIKLNMTKFDYLIVKNNNFNINFNYT